MEQSRLNLKIPTFFKEYLTEVSWQNKKCITQYILDLVEQDMAKHIDIIKNIKEK